MPEIDELIKEFLILSKLYSPYNKGSLQKEAKQ